jgi:Arm domain-containing DNA-binding protein
MPTLDRPFTKRFIDTLPFAESGPVFHWEGGDGAVKGFGCKVYPTGRKSFVFQYDDPGGRARRISLGRYGALTVDQARTIARQHAASVATARSNPNALDPARARDAARRNAIAAATELTMAELFDRFLEDRTRRAMKPSTLREYVLARVR